MQTVLQTDIPALPLISRGKVRDIYAVDDERLLIVTTDRLSAFDVILPDPIPQKGAVLNRITLFWMRMFQDVVPNHILASEVADFPTELQPYADQLEGRAVIVRRCAPLPIECIVRGYITGSGWKDYQRTGAVSGHVLPQGLQESAELTQPIFTPSTKAELGAHDENITRDKAAELVGRKLFAKVESVSLEIYTRARAYARQRGILIADTKFEFGLAGKELVWIDEALTPDSSRFWPADGYAPGRGQPSFDKQFVRNYLEEIGFNKQPPAPRLPQEIIQGTRDKYLSIYEMLTGQPLMGEES